MAPEDMPVIILAAGASRRMRGADKLLEEVDGAPLLRRQVRNAIALGAGPVLVALPPAPHPRYNALDGLSYLPVPVADAQEGMNASIRAAFAALPPDALCAMLLLADLPDITAEDLRTVAKAVDLLSDTLIWRGATEANSPGHPIIFRAMLFEALRALTGDTGAKDVVTRAKDRVVLVPLEGDRARLDLDTPEAWEAWRRNTETRRPDEP